MFKRDPQCVVPMIVLSSAAFDALGIPFAASQDCVETRDIDSRESQRFEGIGHNVPPSQAYWKDPACMAYHRTWEVLGCIREVTPEEGRRFADDHGCPYMECSAKDNKNVNEVFGMLTQQTIQFLKIQPDKVCGLPYDEEEEQRKKKCLIA
eukprot:PhF_6_TR27925/c0_g1_i2/m.41090